MLSPDDVYAFESGGRFIPRDKCSGMAFLHDFGTHGWWKSVEECTSAFTNSMESGLSKFSHLGAKTHDLLGSSRVVALVYHGTMTDIELAHLQFVLMEKYKKEFFIVNVVENSCGQDDSPVLLGESAIKVFVYDSLSPKRGTPREWEGWDESWRKALSHIPLHGKLDCRAF